MKMVSTKRTKEDMKKSSESMNKIAPDPYPYSTRICLDKHVLDKLDISPKDFKVGQVVTIEAICVVKSLRMVEGKDYDTNEIELQMQQVGIENKGKTLKDAVEEAVKEAK